MRSSPRSSTRAFVPPAAAPPAPAVPPAPPADALTAVGRVMRTLLSPLDHPSWLAWRDAAHRELLGLPGVDALGMHTPLEGAESGAAAWHVPHVPADAARAFATELLPHDITERRLVERRLEAAHQTELVDRPTLERNVVFAEFVAPNQLEDTTLALLALAGGVQARLWFTGRSRTPWRPDSARGACIHAVLPALRAGLVAWQHVGAHRADLGRMVDALREPVLLYATSGELLHANPAARALPTGEAGERLRHAAERVVWETGALARHGARALPTPPASAVVRAGGARWTLRATLAPQSMAGTEPVVLVTVDGGSPSSAAALDDAALRERHGLTPREITVARLVAEGLTNREIATRLGLSYFTVRNCVERVLGRLGATTRARVGAVLRGDG